MARAYDFWDSFDRENFNPDGTITESYRARLMSRGKALEDTWAMEARKMAEVKEFEEREQRFLQRYGMTWSEWSQSGQEQLTLQEQSARQQAALQEGAELSELPYDIEPEDYYDYHAGYPG
ncbi:phosphoribosyl-ATP pyrophosphatase [Coleofasciculus sp.]|uniref:phosphoribosyl-ATP pyrophosphatase n=1 Tax=Coleofasciculus sp. TaxID=3100458 RepID=UPI003A35B8D0